MGDSWTLRRDCATECCSLESVIEFIQIAYSPSIVELLRLELTRPVVYLEVVPSFTSTAQFKLLAWQLLSLL